MEWSLSWVQGGETRTLSSQTILSILFENVVNKDKTAPKSQCNSFPMIFTANAKNPQNKQNYSLHECSHLLLLNPQPGRLWG